MKLKLEIEMDNAAFDDGNGGNSEAARILREAADRIESGNDNTGLLDSNGNRVGNCCIED